MDKAPLYLTVGVDCGNGLPPPVLPRRNFWHDLLTDLAHQFRRDIHIVQALDLLRDVPLAFFVPQLRVQLALHYLLQIVPKHFLHRIHDFCGAAEVLAVHVGLQLFPRLVCAVAASNILGYADLNAITTKIIALTRPDWAGFSLPLIIISDIGIFQRFLSSAVRSFT